MVTCGYCEGEGHSIRSCQYKDNLPYIHAVVGEVREPSYENYADGERQMSSVFRCYREF